MKAKNLRIEVYDNKDIGVCSIKDHFKENWHTGIPQIDNIESIITTNSSFDGIKLVEVETNEVLFELKGQEALRLDLLDAAIKRRIQISKA